MMSSAMDSADMSLSTSTYKTIPQYFTTQTGWSLKTGDATKIAISNKRHKILLQNSPQLKILQNCSFYWIVCFAHTLCPGSNSHNYSHTIDSYNCEKIMK